MKQKTQMALLWVVAIGLVIFGVTRGNNKAKAESTPMPTATVTPEPTPTPKLKWLYEEYNEELDIAVKSGKAKETDGVYTTTGEADIYTEEKEAINDINLWYKLCGHDNYLHEFDYYYKQYGRMSAYKTALVELMKETDDHYPHELVSKNTWKNKKFYESAEKYYNAIEDYALDLIQFAQFGNEYYDSLFLAELDINSYREKVAEQAVTYFLSRGVELRKIGYEEIKDLKY